MLLAVVALVAGPGTDGETAPGGGPAAAPNITVSKTDNLVAGVVEPGDLIQYGVVIANSGADAADGVEFVDNLDLHTTLVDGSVNASPLAFDDEYTTAVDTELVVPAGSSVILNDLEFLGDDFTLTPIVAGATAQGGTVDLAANGSFTYEPAAAFTGTDTFTYTISDDGVDGVASGDDLTDEGTVTITVTDEVFHFGGFFGLTDLYAAALGGGAVMEDAGSFTEIALAPGPGAVSPAPGVSGEVVIVTIGTLPAGKDVTVVFDVIVDGAPEEPPPATQVANQALVTGFFGVNDIEVYSDDPETGAPGDPTITQLDVNHAPVLLDADLGVPSTEDAAAPSGAVGTLVSDLVDTNPPAGGLDNVIDPDTNNQLGIALVGSNTANGSWFYSTNGGAFWNQLGNVAEDAALVLLADGDTRLYFQPTADFEGAVPFALTIRAWDQTGAEVNGEGDIDLTLPFATGSNRPFSAATDNVVVVVSEVNDAPDAVDDTLSDHAEDGGDKTIAFTDLTGNDSAGPNEGGQALTVVGVSNVTGGSAQILGTDVIFTPADDFHGTASFDYSIEDDGTTNGVDDFLGDTATASFTVTPVADTPSVSDATTAEDTQTTTGLGLTPNAADGAEVTHYKITAITNGSLYQADGTTAIANGDFITVTEGAAGLKFTPDENENVAAGDTFSFSAQASTAANAAGLGGSTVTATITVTEVNDAPVAGDDTLSGHTEDAGGKTIAFADLDGNDTAGPANESGQSILVTSVSNPVGGTVQIVATDVVFTPFADFNGTAEFDYTIEDNGTTNGVPDPQTATGHATFSVDPVADTPSVTGTTTDEDTLSSSGLVVSRNVADGVEVTHFKITNITNGTLYQADGTTQIDDGDFITAAEGGAGLRFLPDDDLNSASPLATFGFDVQASVSAGDGGLGGSTASAIITVNAVNDTPSADPQTVHVEEDDVAGVVITLTGDGEDPEITQSLTFEVVDQPAHGDLSGTGDTLTYVPDADYSGADSFTFTVTDDADAGGAALTSAAATITIAVDPINDEPSWTPGPDQETPAGAGPQTTTDWVDSFVPGPDSESGQAVAQYTITDVDNDEVFDVQPAIAADGTLTYTPVDSIATATTAVVTATVQDDGGTAVTGDDDTSQEQTFSITIRPPRVVVAPTTGLATDEQGATDTFVVTLEVEPSSAVSIDIESSDTTEGTVDTAEVVLDGTNWDTGVTVTVTGVDDDVDDGDIAYTVTTGTAESADLDFDGLAVDDVAVTNTDDDTAGVTVTPAGSMETTEAAGTATFEIVLDSEPTADVTIGISSDDTTEGTVSTASVTFTAADWDDPQTITLTGVDDAIDDGDVAYNAVIAAATSDDANYDGLDADDVVATNLDDEAAPEVGFAAATGSGNEVLPGLIEVVLDHGSTQTVTVAYTVVGGTASGADRLATSGVLTFNPLDVSETINLAVVDDALDEADETVELELSGPTNATLGDEAAHIYTILDNDAAPQVGFALTTSSGTESGTLVSLQVVLSAASGKTVTVDHAATGGTATAILDYVAAPGTVTFAPGDLSKLIPLTVVNDEIDEENESIELDLANPVNATLGAAGHTRIITDDDATPGVRFETATSAGQEIPPTALVRVVMDRQSSRTVVVPFEVAGGTAEPGRDFDPPASVVTFAPGDLVQDIAIPLVIDGLYERPETIVLELGTPTNAELDDVIQHTFTVLSGRATRSCAGKLETLIRTVGNTIYGTPGDDVIVGSKGVDRIEGLGGNDIICALAGSDIVNGGPGNDRLFSGSGDDAMHGGAGDDLLVGENGKNTLNGGPGNDRINARGGSDNIFGGGGNDVIQAGGDMDAVSGGAGADRIFGNQGDDLLRGNGGDDTIRGGSGADQVFGDANDDTLYGQAGKDSCNGGAGTDATPAGASCETTTNVP